MLVYLLGSVDGLNLDTKQFIGLGKALAALEGLLLGKYDGMELGSLQYYPDVNSNGNIEGLLLGACFRSLIGIQVGNNEGTEIGL